MYEDHHIITQPHQSILNHQQIVTRLEGTADIEDHDDKYNHNVKRLKYDTEI